MRVVTFETDPKEYHDGLLKYTCEVNGVALKVLGIGEEWIGVKQKIFGYLDYMKGLPEDEIVICCDNRDVIIPRVVNIATSEEVNNKIFKIISTSSLALLFCLIFL